MPSKVSTVLTYFGVGDELSTQLDDKRLHGLLSGHTIQILQIMRPDLAVCAFVTSKQNALAILAVAPAR